MATPLAEAWNTAIAQGNVQRVKELMTGALQEAPVTLRAPFVLAALTHRSAAMVQALLPRYASQINEPGMDGRTALWIALGFGHTQTARRLLEAGADPNAPVRSGLTPWEFALGEGLADLVVPLKQHNAGLSSWPDLAWEQVKAGNRQAVAHALLKAGIVPHRGTSVDGWVNRPEWESVAQHLLVIRREEELNGGLPAASETDIKRQRF